MSLRVDIAAESRFARELAALAPKLGIPPNFDKLPPNDRADILSKIDTDPASVGEFVRLSARVNLLWSVG